MHYPGCDGSETGFVEAAVFLGVKCGGGVDLLVEMGSLSNVDSWGGKNFGKRVESKCCGGTSGCDFFGVGVIG
eukprot:6475563-Amphidinium_carterae.1